MGLGDFILIIDKLGWFGVFITLIFITVMFIGALVDIFQFWWVMKRLSKKRERSKYDKIKAQILLDHYESIIKQHSRPARAHPENPQK